MNSWFSDIKDKTKGMSNKESLDYILTYYWYHILIFCGIVILVIIFAAHYLMGNQRPEFSLVMVNQEINTPRDNRITEAFAAFSGIDVGSIDIDSNYNFSYGDIAISGVNETSYEKFFLRWRNNELDAVIMPESFYNYCVAMGGSFRDLEMMDTGDLILYTDDGDSSGGSEDGADGDNADGDEGNVRNGSDGEKNTAVILGEDRMTGVISGGEGETLLLAFPANGEHPEASQEFLSFIQEDDILTEGESAITGDVVS